MSKKTKTTSNTNTAITPTNPAWVDNGLAGMGQTISDLQSRDPYSFTVGADPLQTSAGNISSGLGAGMPDAVAGFNGGLDNASGILNGVAGASGATANPYIQNYMDPYLNDVVSNSLNSFDKGAGYQLAQANLDLGGDSTFGGSGGAIGKALLQGNLVDQRAGVDSSLRSAGYTQALGAAQQDANRQQQQQALQAQAASQLAQIAQARLTGAGMVDENSRANAASQATIGDQLRQIDLQRTLAPISTATAIGGLWNGLPLNLLHGENQNSQSTSTTKTSDPMGTIAGLAGAAGSVMTGLGGLGLAFGGGGLGSLGAGLTGSSGAFSQGLGNTLAGFKF